MIVKYIKLPQSAKKKSLWWNEFYVTRHRGLFDVLVFCKFARIWEERFLKLLFTKYYTVLVGGVCVGEISRILKLNDIETVKLTVDNKQ